MNVSPYFHTIPVNPFDILISEHRGKNVQKCDVDDTVLLSGETLQGRNQSIKFFKNYLHIKRKGFSGSFAETTDKK